MIDDWVNPGFCSPDPLRKYSPLGRIDSKQGCIGTESYHHITRKLGRQNPDLHNLGEDGHSPSCLQLGTPLPHGGLALL